MSLKSESKYFAIMFLIDVILFMIFVLFNLSEWIALVPLGVIPFWSPFLISIETDKGTRIFPNLSLLMSLVIVLANLIAIKKIEHNAK